MIQKILKIQLIVLFFLTLVVCGTYYFADSLPDNYLLIQSTDQTFNYVIYYVMSLLVLIEYSTGPWIFLVFFIYALFYAFLYSRRNFKLDLLCLPIMFFLNWLMFSAFYPSLLGAGLLHLSGENNSPYLSLTIIVLTVVGLLFLSLRAQFVQFTKDCFLKLTRLQFRNMFNLKFIFQSTTILPFKRFVFKNQRLFKQKCTNILTGSEYLDNKADQEVRTQPSEGDDDLNNNNLSTAKYIPQIIDRSIKEIRAKEYIAKAQSSAPSDTDYYEIVKSIEKNQTINRNQGPDNFYFENIINRIEDKLQEFNIDGHIINILKGPVVDTFELELGSGVRVSKVTSSTEDLKMALHGAPIRIVYPMRGKTTIGIEVPRNPREIIYLDEILTSKDFQNSKYSLPLAMGKDAFGQPFIVDLASMPHMLVAGATGSGKSVFINSILVSLLVKKSPSHMKLILIDPKKLELSLYANLPHLLLPVVTEAKIASLSLAWVVQEMERRYSILKEFQVRNISGFNQKLKGATSEMRSKIQPFYSDISSDADLELPYIVVIVDEFADLILTKAGKEIEGNICRLAGKARAAGIHLIIATQRPSVDVITGLIKSNFPTRVSFRVSTSIDSRTILSAMGAENLLGKGDMLYKNGVETFRVHSSFVDEDEIEVLTNKISEIGPVYNQEALNFIDTEGEQSDDPYAFGSHIAAVKEEGDDNLFDEAVNIVIEYRAASASMLQRRLKIGYNRAANLIEKMEEKGIVGPQQGSKPRKVLASSDHHL